MNPRLTRPCRRRFIPAPRYTRRSGLCTKTRPGLTPAFGASHNSDRRAIFRTCRRALRAASPAAGAVRAASRAAEGPSIRGLTLKPFQQNIGLTGAQTPQEEQAPQPAARHLCAVVLSGAAGAAARQGRLSAPSPEGRTLMGTAPSSDDEHQPTTFLPGPADDDWILRPLPRAPIASKTRGTPRGGMTPLISLTYQYYVLVGNYGGGKTELSLSLARLKKQSRGKVALVAFGHCQSICFP